MSTVPGLFPDLLFDHFSKVLFLKMDSPAISGILELFFFKVVFLKIESPAISGIIELAAAAAGGGGAAPAARAQKGPLWGPMGPT